MVAMAKSSAGWILRKLARYRHWVQAAFLLVWLDPLMVRWHGVCAPVFHCHSCPLATFACPIGVLANFSALHVFPFMVIGTLLLVGGVFGSFVCGWACPFGFLQDLIGKLPVRKFSLPGWLGYTRYAVLVGLVLVVPFVFTKESPLFFCRLCPVGTLEGAVPSIIQTAVRGEAVSWPSAAKMSILGLVVVAAVVKYRPWCSLLCPLGAIFGLCNRGSLLALRYKGETCRSCGSCDKMCRYGVLPSRDLNNSRCIRCLECTKCNAITAMMAFGLPGDGRRGPGDVERALIAVEACEQVGTEGQRDGGTEG